MRNQPKTSSYSRSIWIKYIPLLVKRATGLLFILKIWRLLKPTTPTLLTLGPWERLNSQTWPNKSLLPYTLLNKVRLKKSQISKLRVNNIFYNLVDPNCQAVDWRKESGVAGQVKDQGRCGSHWAFSAVGAVEAYHAVVRGQRNLDLSE